MAQPSRFDEPGPPGGVERRKPLQFPHREPLRTINIWRVTLYTVIVIVILAAIGWWIVHL